MQIIKFIYNEKEIEFEPSGNNNVMVNATQMAKVFGNEVTFFRRNDDTKKFIDACLKIENSQFLGIEKK
nr:hypothetical protein [Bacteroidota bacterium]